jgi:trehalose synthase
MNLQGKTLPDLSDRTVLITGGSSGIGNSIAYALVEAGARVTVVSRRSPRDWERQMPTGWNAERSWLPADLSELEPTIDRLEKWLASAGQALDAWVHAAVDYGSTSRRTLMQIRIEEWDRVFQAGPRAYFIISRAVIPILLRRPCGLVISLSSEVAYHAGPGRIDYAASKAASRSLSSSLAKELQQSRVRIIDLLPEGMVDTPGIRRRRNSDADFSSFAPADSFAAPALKLIETMGEGLSGKVFVVTASGKMVPFESHRSPSQTRRADVITLTPSEEAWRSRAMRMPHLDLVNPPLIKQYEGLVDDELLHDIERLARELRGLRVAHYNTTARGGGVAVLLRTLLSAASAMGVEHETEVITLDKPSCQFMVSITDLLQGGGSGMLNPKSQDDFLARLSFALGGHQRQADVHWVHDVQLVPMAALLPSLRPAIWVSHLDTAAPNQSAAAFVRSFLRDYELCVNNTPYTALMAGATVPFEVLELGIAGQSQNHSPLAAEYRAIILSKFGIDPNRPLVVQVSRFGKWKNPFQAIDIYRVLRSRVPGVQLALVGALEATDDLAAEEVLESVRCHAKNEPDVHLLSDPSQISDEVVNAFQQSADVVLQRSAREGFGFTVTEAMWKHKPVVGTSATGVGYQISHGVNGFIADDTLVAASYAAELLVDNCLRERMGQAAHETVRKNFLLPVMLRSYFTLLQRATRTMK